MATRCCEALGHIANVCKARLRLADLKRPEELSRGRTEPHRGQGEDEDGRRTCVEVEGIYRFNEISAEIVP